MSYDPPRQTQPNAPQDPLEIELVYNVRPCGTCDFFWPQDSATQPYGPYSSYDFSSQFPAGNGPNGSTGSFVWIQGVTRPPSFPAAEIMDGCRKAPIMTIGINPNLTAFAPGQTGASWCYPSFSGANGTDPAAKYAYYYRYRSVYQEHFDLAFAEKYLLPAGQIKAAKAGVMQSVVRASDAPAYNIEVKYDGDATATAIHLPGELGQAPYAVLVNSGDHFAQGDLLAAMISVPAGQQVDVYDEPIGYYTQMLPVLSDFESFLQSKGHAGAQLKVGEDVAQLDMVACASPHWDKPWLGGTSQSVNTVIKNCVQKNAWALKQWLQTQPAVLFLVGQSSWTMFLQSFGHLVNADPPIPKVPVDGPYTLLRQTTTNDCRIEYSTTIAGVAYSISTRLVITPHFSYNENFLPQFRLSQDAWKQFAATYADAAHFLQTDPRIQFQSPAGAYVSAAITKDTAAVLQALKTSYADADAALQPCFYDAHAEMSGVLQELFTAGQISWTDGSGAQASGYLSRGDGPCQFCDNNHWQFPQGCPYGKPTVKQYPIGFLENVAQEIIAGAS
jgi:hypothetical protein